MTRLLAPAWAAFVVAAGWTAFRPARGRRPRAFEPPAPAGRGRRPPAWLAARCPGTDFPASRPSGARTGRSPGPRRRPPALRPTSGAPLIPAAGPWRGALVAAATVAAAALWWPAAVAPPALAAGLPRLRAGRAAAERRSALAAELPDVIDLLRVAVVSGLNVRLSVEAVARRAPPGPLAAGLVLVAEMVRAGARLADSLDGLPGTVGEPARPLAAALADAERYGTSLAPVLDRLADASRLSRQRAVEEEARRVPVRLLFPLVTCILPAMGLLTVAPLLAGGLRALRLP